MGFLGNSPLKRTRFITRDGQTDTHRRLKSTKQQADTVEEAADDGTENESGAVAVAAHFITVLLHT
jgi:hypothetical protein